MGTITSLTLFEQQCMEQKIFKLKTLKDFGHATYKGFTLRNGYRYGITEEDGIHVADFKLAAREFHLHVLLQ